MANLACQEGLEIERTALHAEVVGKDGELPSNKASPQFLWHSGDSHASAGRPNKLICDDGHNRFKSATTSANRKTTTCRSFMVLPTHLRNRHFAILIVTIKILYPRIFARHSPHNSCFLLDSIGRGVLSLSIGYRPTKSSGRTRYSNEQSNY
jgi:hypothetical protein